MHPYDSQQVCVSGVMSFGWYALYTRHQHEKSAAQQLASKGFNVLLPLYRSANRWKDRTQIVHLPLFPNYLFVQADLTGKLEILRTPGVCHLVCSAGMPVRMVSTEIEAIQRMASSSCDLQPHPFLKRGDRVRIVNGPLIGLEGVLAREKNQLRVVVSIGLLRKSASVEVDLNSLEPVNCASNLAKLCELAEF